MTVIRPDGSKRVDRIDPPIGDMSRGRYQLNFTCDGQAAAPAFFTVEDVPILGAIGATFMFSPTPLALDDIRGIATLAPTVTLLPGETYKLMLSPHGALAALPRPAPPGNYDVTVSTTLEVLIGDRDGEWAELCPVRLPVTSTVPGVVR